MSGELFSSDGFEWAGERWIVARRQLREPPMRFAIAAPLAPITEPFSQAARRAALALMGVLAVGLIVSMLMTRRITGPLERLALAADDVAAGRFERRVDETGPDELQRLGGAFNTMAQSLRSTLQQLAQREAVAAVGEFAASLAHECAIRSRRSASISSARVSGWTIPHARTSSSRERSARSTGWRAR
jgi:HAMP domain-containing protein